MKKITLFEDFIFEFDYPNHDKYKNFWVNFLLNEAKDRNLYFVENKNKYINYTRPILHKVPEFVPITEYLHSCVNTVMDYTGYHPKTIVNSMWATIQLKNNYHHLHTHGNTFLAGLYYLHTVENNAKGTVFFNDRASRNNIINPKRKNNNIVGEYHKTKYTTKFIPGKIYIFPSYMLHYVETSIDSGRIIISMNTMPVGKADHDIFDSYNYMPQA